MKHTDYVKTFQTKIELGLGRMRALLDELENPEKDIKLIHVTGTNGKGSVCAFLERMLIVSGARVGLYSSPELYEKTEVIRLGGKNISSHELDRLIESTKSACEATEKKLGEYPSQFEIMTACAFLYFKEKNADIVIMEVGMGGEGDATNVCEAARLAVITKISVDHTAYLGDTIEQIAKVKAGIIKTGCTVVTTDKNQKVMGVIKNKCKKMGADLKICESFPLTDFSGIYEKIGDITLALGGINQLENAAVAATCARELGIGEEHIKIGLETAVHKGRMERIFDNFYFDGAHNADGAMALRRNIDRYFAGRKIIYLMGSMKDKDVLATLKVLNSDNASFKFVTADVPGRAMGADELLEISKQAGIKNAQCYRDLKTAYADALADKKAITIACGSLYLYKDFKNKGLF